MFEVKITANSPEELANLTKALNTLTALVHIGLGTDPATGYAAAPVVRPTPEQAQAMAMVAQAHAETAVTAPPAPAEPEPVAATEEKKSRGRPKKEVAAKPEEATVYSLNFADGSLEETFTDLSEWATAFEDRMNSVGSADELRQLNTSNALTTEVLMKADEKRFGALLEVFKSALAGFEAVQQLSDDAEEAVAEEKAWTKEEVQSLVRDYCNTHGMKAGVEKLKNEFDVERVSDMPAAAYARAAKSFAA
ncbi:protein of unknown function [Magnetospirillum sp. XM-1]|uniref:hypothetical protein n=1 Tax=Magnetospirillum sp. XM-1 TaxID=1663591 RepID=UPI00073DD2A8|nr:hypothetical protein [Magnetospirillum sp. XM-1]CUW38824.1 protein of unknown function [Magnetospirillum sp. XM-1]